MSTKRASVLPYRSKPCDEKERAHQCDTSATRTCVAAVTNMALDEGCDSAREAEKREVEHAQEVSYVRGLETNGSMCV